MPSSSKICFPNKQRFEENTTVCLTEECSTILQNKLPLKLKDVGSFSIPCVMSDIAISYALCDLGASVSLMPYLILHKLWPPPPWRMLVIG